MANFTGSLSLFLGMKSARVICDGEGLFLRRLETSLKWPSVSSMTHPKKSTGSSLTLFTGFFCGECCFWGQFLDICPGLPQP